MATETFHHHRSVVLTSQTEKGKENKISKFANKLNGLGMHCCLVPHATASTDDDDDDVDEIDEKKGWFFS